MNHAAVIRILSAILIGMGGIMVFTGLIALLAGEGDQVVSFGLSASFCLVVGLAGALLTGKPTRPASVQDGLAVAILFWLIIPLPAAIPFVFGVAEPSAFTAWHEAVSCITTSGQSVIEVYQDDWPDSLLFWRAALHVIGATASLVIVLSIFSAMNLDGPGVHRSIFFTLPDGSFFDGTPRIIRTVFLLLASLTAILFFLLLLEGRAPELAIADALSVSTTGLILPNQIELDGPYGLGALILGLGLVATASGVAVLVNLHARRWRAAIFDPEVLLLVCLVLAFAIVAWMANVGPISAIGWAVSALSTSGVSLGTPTANHLTTLPISIVILPAIIGGSALSTAGGIKLARVFILLRRAAQEFSRLGYRNSVVALTYRNRAQDETEIIGIWVYVIAYIAAMTGLFVFLSFLGSGFSSALMESVGAVTNSGWLIDTDTDRGPLHQTALIFAMIIGRLEVLALIPAVSVAFWQN